MNDSCLFLAYQKQRNIDLSSCGAGCMYVYIYMSIYKDVYACIYTIYVYTYV